MRLIVLLASSPVALYEPEPTLLALAWLMAVTHVLAPGEGDGLALAISFTAALAARDLFGDHFGTLAALMCVGGAGAYALKHGLIPRLR